MSDTSIDFHHAYFAKTAIGQQEIQNRALRLAPLVRRLLILIDGKRSGQELAAFVNGHAVADLLGELLTHKCVEVIATTPAPVVTPAAPPLPEKTSPAVMDNAALAALPPAESRSAKEVEMARNFMTNTVNTIFQPNTRLTLLKEIFACKTADEARAVYPHWAETIRSSAMGAKRLAEFNVKLFKVL